MWRSKIPDEWTISVIVLIFKNKGDILDCRQYRGIKLLEHGLKVLERVLDERVRKMMEVDPRQFGFMPEKNTIDAIFIIRQLMEKEIEGILESYLGFVDLEKAYDRVPREGIYWSLRRKGVQEKLVKLIQATHRNSKTAVRTEANSSREFCISVGLHQGSALSPPLFAIIVDELTKGKRDLGAVVYRRSSGNKYIEKGAPEELKRWQRCLEKGGLKVNVAKTETLACKRVEGGKVLRVRDVHGEEIRQVKEFKCLGTVLCEGGGKSRDVQERVKAGWIKWGEVSVVMKDKRMGMRLKAKVYQTVVRPVMTYGPQCWALNKIDERRPEVMEMNMLRGLLGVTRRHILRNKEVRERTGVQENIVKVVEGSKMRWYGHVVRKGERE